jgi:hypothetical protein
VASAGTWSPLDLMAAVVRGGSLLGGAVSIESSSSSRGVCVSVACGGYGRSRAGAIWSSYDIGTRELDGGGMLLVGDLVLVDLLVRRLFVLGSDEFLRTCLSYNLTRAALLHHKPHEIPCSFSFDLSCNIVSEAAFFCLGMFSG